jgi:cellulose biosynthesis protein BcsQ
VTVTEEEQGEFKNNQSVRVFYQQITDISATFNKNWQGITPNDADGRSAFRGVVIKYLQTLQDIRAIQEFDPDTVVVEKGDAKGAVLLSYPTNAVNAMYQLYATITVQ